MSNALFRPGARVISAASGTPDHVITDGVANTDVLLDCSQVRHLRVIHIISAGGAGGYCSLSTPIGAVDVPHHAEGQNIKSSDQTVSYECIFKNVAAQVKLTLHRTADTHNVYVEGIS